MNKKQKEVIKESARHSIRVAWNQYKEFTKEDIERKKRATRDARLVKILI